MFAAIAALAIGFPSLQDYRPDLNLLIDSLKQNGAYVREDHIDLDVLRAAYSGKFAQVPDKQQLLSLLETLMSELHDFHATLGTNNSASPRLVPSGTDIFAHWEGAHAIVDQVRIGSLAEKSGLTAGDEILRISDKPTRTECQSWLGVRKPDERGWDWALNSALAGRWNTIRTLTVTSHSLKRDLKFATALDPKYKQVLTVASRRVNPLLAAREQPR